MSALGLGTLMVGMAGCGQRGPLVLPTDPAAKGRATLPQVLVPGLRSPLTAAGPEPAGDANPPPTEPGSEGRGSSPTSSNAPASGGSGSLR